VCIRFDPVRFEDGARDARPRTRGHGRVIITPTF
jgi:hypothetical protein